MLHWLAKVYLASRKRRLFQLLQRGQGCQVRKAIAVDWAIGKHEPSQAHQDVEASHAVVADARSRLSNADSMPMG
jgi:hypothetical protein